MERLIYKMYKEGMRDKMKRLKKGVAVILTAAFLLPSQPFIVTNATPTETVKEETLLSEEKESPTETEVNSDSAAEETAKETEEISSAAEESTNEETTIPEEETQGGETSETMTLEEENMESTEVESVAAGATEDSGELTEDERTEDQESREYAEETSSVTETTTTEEESSLETVAQSPVSQLDMESDAIGFNTGRHVFKVVSQSTWDQGMGDAFFSEDGSYTINIPEANPFFPYEVQFTYNGITENQWFMTPDDSVTVNGHTFYVSAYFDNTKITQMSLNVAGETVVVYPKKKEFTDGDGTMELSLLPLAEDNFEVDFTSFTPIELTRVSVDSIFTGNNALSDTSKVMWTYGSDGDTYKVSPKEGFINLSLGTNNGITYWQMIVGDDNQLAETNIRYKVAVKVTDSKNWLVPTVYEEDGQGNRTKVNVLESSYHDGQDVYASHNLHHNFYIKLDRNQGYIKNTYIGLQVNQDVFGSPLYDEIKVYTGNYTDPEEAASNGTDITERIFGTFGTVSQEEISFFRYITMITYQAGKATGCLPIRLMFVGPRSYSYSIHGLFAGPGIQSEQVSDRFYYPYEDGLFSEEDGYDEWEASTKVYLLKDGYPANRTYYVTYEWFKNDISSPEMVKAAYIGKYSSMEEAANAGAQDIKSLLLDQNQGYGADYSQGVPLTIFIEDDQRPKPVVWKFIIKTEAWSPILSGNAVVNFTGLKSNGNAVTHCMIEEDEDSYGEENYLTFLVNKDTDLTNLAPEFITLSGIKLYTAGSSSPEESGVTAHDFSKGAIAYTASAENGENAKNYWIQVVKAADGQGKLYINSLEDQHAETRYEGDTAYSTREMFLDERYDYRHDILLINAGTEALPNLKAELVSDEVELDPYWRLNGDYGLAGFEDMNQTISYKNDTHYGSLKNLAKLRFIPKTGMDDGREISGTLTIKSGDKVLMVLTLTGVVGDPSITTTEIPDAVKYVPYGTMIQNSNKYTWNKPRYYLAGGSLPEGMTLKPNGELYGVPKENGEFTFTVVMQNSYGSQPTSEKTLTLTVQDNSNLNVFNASDSGYELLEHVGTEVSSDTRDYLLAVPSEQLFVSNGQFGEFIDFWLNGEKLVEGEDYTKESGSTRITIRKQTFEKKANRGTNTISAEFRVQGDQAKELKRTAQNFRMEEPKSNSGTGTSTSTGSSGGSRGDGANVSLISYDSKKGYVHARTGIITKNVSGYSKWEQDENGWKLCYANKTYACGTMITLENGTMAEQILWEKINGSWYAFGVNGYLKSGWVYDYQLNGWYNVSVESGMRSSWYTDPQDQNTYYLEPQAGKMAIGWKTIDSKWYYFNAVALNPTWQLNKETGNWDYNTKSKSKPFGAMYKNGKTPDGYYVDQDGVWDGKEK